ncbi:MAG: pre-peptidase C-terminal domain-containing protein [Thermoanaerobaculia bacterium]|nr:pre-peptidase C-terminal domain-containing protein [Thermoanaerobaculia bacterium]
MRRTTRSGTLVGLALLGLAFVATPRASAQQIDQRLGVDSRVDYAAMMQLGPWDDRNYLLTKDDLAVLAPNEHELKAAIPVFFRVELRKSNPKMLREGVAQYARSAPEVFKMRYGGYLVNGKLYKTATIQDGVYKIVEKNGVTQEEFAINALTSDVKVTSPTGAAESAVKISPVDANKVIAGSNGPGSGQIMWYSTNGGSSWTQAAALPQGGTCCDPTIDWSANGQYAYTSTLGGCTNLCNIWVYRSSDGGVTWNDLATITPGDGRRELTSAGTSDKEFIHSDKFATSPRKDNIYLCWHDNNTMKFSRSTDFANTWSANLTMSSGAAQSGIGCDISSDKNGNVYYFWPATDGKTILMRKSTDGGATFASAVTVANTQDGYDFAIPAMETRRAFIYASTDVDLSAGAFANTIYAAWTDTTAPENTTTPANNHARIQVAYSRDGGATWTIRTPHPTADANTVDRFHPWIGVAPDGKVYVMFYDTTRSATRVGVDVYYSVSSDGGNTWAAPTRMTTVLSPQIDDGFEWGDYNGLDVMGNQLIAIFTDNRNESGAAADSIDVYAAGITLGGGPGNTTPSVTISAPTNGASFTTGTSVTFTGTATDVEDGTLTAGLTWTSSINGTIGTGGSFSTSTLSVGTHTITASATDTGGATGSASISITVNATAGVLTNGVAVTGLAGATGSQQFFTMAIPAGATNLSFTTSGGTGDADLYVRFGTPPTTTTSDCSSAGGTNAETCSFPAPSTGTYHVLVYGFATFSGAQIVGSYTAPGGSVTVTFYSIGAEDGRIWESGETTGVGAAGNSTDNNTTAIRVGDTNVDEQYRSIVSFDTSSIPDTATITAATIRLVRASLSGTSPFTTHTACVADISTGGFGGNAAFATADFQAAATATNVATLSAPASNGAASTGTLSATGRNAISKTAKTQFRLYCTLDDNDDLGFDYIGFYPGENATNANKPQLTVTYTP